MMQAHAMPRFKTAGMKPFLLLLVGGVLGLFLERYWSHRDLGFGLGGKDAVAALGENSASQASAPRPEGNPQGTMGLAGANDGVSQGRRNAIVLAAEKASPSVVSITVKRSQVVAYRNPYFNDPFFEFFAPELRKREFSSLGSGVIVSDKGFILTNAHVVGGGEEGEGGTLEMLQVTLPDGRKFSAKLVGLDKDIDLAVLRIEGKNLPVAEMQDKADNLIGEWVVAIGNPYGYLIGDSKPTVTVGVISAVGRTFSSQSGIHQHNMIQTDASINPGNSGGALVNAEGKVIGINTFIFTGGGQGQGSIGLGFALPIQKAKLVMDELIRYGYIRQFTTGLYTDPYAEIPVPGMWVAQVEKGSPADKAGIKAGDIIIRVAGRDILNFRDIQDIFKLFQVGESVDITYYRDGKSFGTSMTLTEAGRKGKVY